MRRRNLSLVILFCFALLLAACDGVPLVGSPSPTSTPPGPPVIVLSAPLAGSTLPVGSEVLVRSTSIDAIGVARVELYVNGSLVATGTPPDGETVPRFNLEQPWLPDSEGEYILSVIAYRADGTASGPATVIVRVGEAEEVAGGVTGGTTGDTAGAPTGGTGPAGGNGVFAATPSTTLADDGGGQTAGPTYTYTPSVTPGGPTLTPTYTYTPSVTPGGPTLTPTFTLMPSATTGGPTLTPTYPLTNEPTLTPTSTPTTPPAAQVAPEDARFNAPLNIPLDSTASVTDFVSYPDGDTEDRIQWDITGMNPNAALSGGRARLIISASCFGTGTQHVQFSVGGQTFFCGQTIVDREVTYDNRTGQVVITAVAGEGTYVQWALTGTATRTN
ncbi:MAG: hypothetical protein GX484_10185 [Chloroflexi bacterium]|nr:hypothetical protein [Chloroflexota bacterium]